jgi:hypothetical protein
LKAITDSFENIDWFSEKDSMLWYVNTMFLHPGKNSPWEN